ncbi:MULTISPECIES: arginine deiminase family protein [Bacillus]|uniref:arginine deiminase family protein n=1 Tax=Bacillus TaxID=1386 RepID=UPI0009BE5491|nr:MULTISPECIES: arginine deiminase family protein [Bacillus cereus group]PGL47191.1 hypothetical protein CN914_21720 [Bacillus thuringiensis]
MLKYKIKPFCNSENGTLKEVLLCTPASYNVLGSEVPAVGFAHDFIAELAIEQHHLLKLKLENFGCKVHDVNNDLKDELWDRLVNRIFVRDVGAVYGDKLLMGVSGNEIRQADFSYTQSAMVDWFDADHTYFVPSCVSLEFGDFLIVSPECVLINTGHRTNNKEELALFLFGLGVEEVGFVSLPRTMESLHLDVVCNILGGNLFLAAPFLKFTTVSVYRKSNESKKYELNTIDEFVGRHGYSIYWLPDKNYLIDYTNFINLDKNTVLVNEEVVPFYQRQFTDMNFIGVQVNHLQHGAGSIRCMTMPFVRGSE